MPDQEVKYVVKIEKGGSGAADAAADLKKVETQAKSSDTALAGLTKGFGALFAALGGLSILREGVNEFVAAERSMSKLNTALRLSEQALPGVAEGMKALAESLSKTTSFDDTSILNVISKLITFGAKTQNIERLTRSVLDLSTLMDRDLGRATMAMGAALNGEMGVFRSLGIQVDETKSKFDQFNDSLKELEKRLGGQASAAKGTAGGQLDQLQKSWNDRLKQLGGLALGVGAGLGIIDDGSGGTLENLRRELQNPHGVGGTPTRPKAPIDFAALGMPAVAAAGAQADILNARGSSPSRGSLLARRGVSTDAFDQAEMDAAIKFHDEMVAFDEDLIDKKNAAWEKHAELLDKLSLEEMNDARRVADAEIELQQEVTLASLDGVERERAQLEINHERRKAQIRELSFEDEERYADLIALEEDLYKVESARFEHAQTFAGKLGDDFKQIAVNAEHLFSQGLAGAIVDSFEQGGKAFQQFASQFFKTMAQMILQALILRVVQGAVGGLFGGSDAATNAAVNPASRASYFAEGGMVMTGGATALPRFNAIAGEAGRELLTVMARPRTVNIGGLNAQVGQVGGRTLAVTDAGALAGGGKGGEIVIRIEHSQESEVRIVRSSVEGATVRIVQDMGRDTPISRATKRLNV